MSVCELLVGSKCSMSPEFETYIVFKNAYRVLVFYWTVW